jgi:hypothetical protein
MKCLKLKTLKAYFVSLKHNATWQNHCDINETLIHDTCPLKNKKNQETLHLPIGVIVVQEQVAYGKLC